MRLMTTLPVAQSSTGVEYRAASAVDIALWDLFGKHCGQPVHQMLGGACFDRFRVYNTCAGYKYVRSGDFRALANWNPSATAGPYEDLDAFMHRADALAESLLENGITAMKIWPFDVAARETGGRYITSAQLSTCLEPFEKIRKAVGDRMEIMVEFHSLWNLPTARKIAKELEPFKPMWFEDPDRDELPSGARGVRSIHGRVGVCERDSRQPMAVQGLPRPRRHARRHGGPVVGGWSHRGAQDRQHGGDVPPAIRSARLHRPGQLRRCRFTWPSVSRTR